MEQKNAYFSIIMLVVGFAVGFFAREIVTVRSLPSIPRTPTPIQNSQTERLPVPSQEELKQVSGKILIVNRTNITIQPLFGTGAGLRVIIGQDTKIIKQILKNSQQYQQDLANYQKAVSGGTGASIPTTKPLPYLQIPAKASDLHAGDSVRVTAMDNIQGKESFTATAIYILDASAPSSTPTIP